MTDEERADLIAEIGQLRRERERLDNESAIATAKDVGKSVALAPAKAAVGLAGFPGDVRDLAQLGREKFVDPYLPDWMKELDAKQQRINPAANLLKLFPTSSDIRGPIESVTGPWYEPQTRAGKIADTATQTAATMGRNWVRTPMNAAKLTAGITAGSEGAGAVFNDNPWAKAIGGIAGGSYPAFMSAMRDRPGKLARSVLGELTPAQLAAARQLEDEARKLGIPLAATESLDLGHTLTSALANHPAGEAVFRQFLADRPRQVKDAANSQLLAMTGPLKTPAVNAAVAQKAATGAIDSAENFVTSQSSPYYRAAAKDQVPKDKVNQIISDAQRISEADKTGILAPHVQNFIDTLTATPSTPAITGTAGSFGPSVLPGGQGRGPWIPGKAPVPAQPAAPITDIENLDRARKFWRDKVALPFGAAAEAIPKETSTKITGLSMDLKREMADASPTWNAGRMVHQDLTRQHVDPLLQSGVGKLAGKGYDPAAYPPVQRAEDVLANVNEVRPDTIRTVHTALNAQDPNAFKGVAQTWFENSLNKAGADNLTGPPSTIGAKLANALAGSDIQKANLEEIVRGISAATGKNADDAVKGVNTLMEVLRRTGRTPGAGSPTHGRGAIERELGHTFFGDLLSTISLNPLRPVARRYNDAMVSARYKGMAEAMTSDHAIDALVKMSKLHPDGLTAKYYAASILGLDKAAAFTTEGE